MPPSSFVANLSLCTFVTLPDERSNNLVPLYRTMKIVAALVVAAFVLHLRLVWCRVQPILVIALLFLSVATAAGNGSRRRPLDVFDSVPAMRISSYECAHYLMLRPRWNQVFVAYAVWIAYGALFHEGRHAAADLAVLDGLLLPTDIGSSTVISFLRNLTLFLIACATMSPDYLLHRQQQVGAALLVAYAVVLALPSAHGVPQVLSVAETLVRSACFLLMFFASELWRVAVEHYLFVVSICEDSLSVEDLEELRNVAELYPEAEATYAMKLEKPNPDANSNPLRSNFSITALLRSAWVLSVSSSYVAVVASGAFALAAIYYTSIWPEMATKRIIERCKGAPKPARPKLTPPPASTATTGGQITQRRQSSPPVKPVKPAQQTQYTADFDQLFEQHFMERSSQT